MDTRLLPKILLFVVISQCIQAQVLREKTYVQTNQSTYLVTDTLRFSAFLWANNDSISSQLLYVELLSPINTLLQEQMLSIDKGIASSYFILNDTLKTGQYHIRAYTNWQRNWGDSSIYSTPFFIVPNTHTIVARAKATTLKSFQFFPEGGHLVENLPSVLAFKAVDSLGQGVVVSGDIVADNGIIAAHLQTDKRGIGACRFVPLPNQHYQARIITANDTTKFSVPTIAQVGYVLQINHLKSDSLSVKIFVKQSSNASQRLTLVGQAGGQVLFAATDSSGYQSLSLKFATDKFPTGLVHFSLFDGQNKLQCQRTVFVNHHDQPKIAIDFKDDSLTIITNGSNHQPVQSHFSVSTQSYSFDSLSENIETRFLLTSAFDELIDQPQQYFQNKANEVQRLDELILSLPPSNEL